MDPAHSTHYSWWLRPPIDVKDWPVLLDGRSQLFVDEHLVAEKKNVERQFHQPKPYEGNPVLAPEHPWESTTCLAHGTVLREPTGRLRMYYMPWVGEDRFGPEVKYKPALLPLVAFSDDGIRWEKPKLGLHPYYGRNDTNLILPNVPEETAYDQMSVLYDEREADPRRRWKMGIKHSGQRLIENDPSDGSVLKVDPNFREGAGYFAYFSEDGLRWNRQPEPIMTDGWNLKRQKWPLRGVAENQSIMYDRVRNKFVAFVRIMDCRPEIKEFWRARAICESDDFLHWTTPRVLFLPTEDDEPGLQFYSNTGFNYESMYLGLLRCYRSRSTHQVYFQLISSRDGVHWDRAAHRQAFIPNLPLGVIGGGYHSDFSNPPIRMGDELWFYYGSSQFGKNVRPNVGGICLSKLRVDGFASAEGGMRTGNLLTRPLDFTGEKLTLNLACRGGGSIVVEILDRHCQPVAGFTPQEAVPVTGDHVAATATWKDCRDLSSLAGRTIRLKFHITHAGLYSFAIR